MTTIVKTINSATKAVEQINVNGVAAPINVAPGAIVEVQAGRAQVASFIQNGKNLVLVMIDGTEIVLRGYFDNAEGAAKKLILVDENGSVEVQFPTADGSTADGASVDVAPSYVTADADTTGLLADSGVMDTASGVSPVLLGLLGAGAVAALAAGGGGGGGDNAPQKNAVAEEKPEQIVESREELALKLFGEIEQLEQTLHDMNAAAPKAQDLLKQAVLDAEQPATELKDAKDVLDVARKAYHATTSWSKPFGDDGKYQEFKSAEELFNKAEAADALAKETIADSQKIANEIESSIKAINEEIDHKQAEFALKFESDASDTADTDATDKTALFSDDNAPALFTEIAEANNPAPVELAVDTVATMSNPFEDQPQPLMQ